MGLTMSEEVKSEEARSEEAVIGAIVKHVRQFGAYALVERLLSKADTELAGEKIRRIASELADIDEEDLTKAERNILKVVGLTN